MLILPQKQRKKASQLSLADRVSWKLILKREERAFYESLGMTIALQLVLEANDENDLLAQRNSLPLYQYTK